MTNFEIVFAFLWCLAIASIGHFFYSHPFLEGVGLSMLWYVAGIPIRDAIFGRR